MLDPATLAQATHPNLRVGHGILAEFFDARTGTFVLFTQPEPARSLSASVRSRAAATVEVNSLEAESLDAIVRALPEVDFIVGVGGGVTMDAAKYAAWKVGRPLVLAPTIVSVDASVTNTVAVRRGGRLVYEGFVVAEAIVADLRIIAAAPARLNRAGVGDLLSIDTALVDWQLGATRGTITFDPDLAARARSVLLRIRSLADEVGAVTDDALAEILRADAEINGLCLEAGHSGPEEGSEHYFAYQVERVKPQSYVHGELVGLGCVLMTTLQGLDPGPTIGALDRALVQWRPDQLGLTRDDCGRALIGLGAFVREAELPHSVIDEADLRPDVVDHLLSVPGLWAPLTRLPLF